MRAQCESCRSAWEFEVYSSRLRPLRSVLVPHRFRHGGIEALEPRQRSDAGQNRAIRPEIAEPIVATKREKPRRSIRRLIRMLERAGKVRHGELKKSAVHRLLQTHGLSGRPRREATERRAFRHALAGELWMGDVMHGPVVIAPDQKRRSKSYLHLVHRLSCASRAIGRLSPR